MPPPIVTFFRNKCVRLILIIDVIVIIAFFVALILNAMKTAVISLNIAPVDATIKVNGKEYENGDYKFRPGEYKIEVTREGMAAKEFTVEAKSGSVINVATFLVGENNGFNFYRLKGNDESFLKLEEIAAMGDNITIDYDKSAEEFIAGYRRAYDLYMGETLPINYAEFGEERENDQRSLKEVTIMANRDEECRLALCLKVIMIGTEDKNIVEDMLTEKGFNTEDYEIIYKIY